MAVGMMMLFASYGWENIGDDQVWGEELQLARLAAESDFDVLWSAEHHFFDYSFCPDNLQLMTYLAGLYPHMDLGTAAVILPWHDPLRVVEQVAVLDMLCQGRLRFGMGRGLARREFAAFRGTMDESRERFDEASSMIVNALRNGFMEGDGTFYKQPKIDIRPRPKYRFDGRIYAVASSVDSVASAARLGAHMVMFSDRPWRMRSSPRARHPPAEPTCRPWRRRPISARLPVPRCRAVRWRPTHHAAHWPRRRRADASRPASPARRPSGPRRGPAAHS